MTAAVAEAGAAPAVLKYKRRVTPGKIIRETLFYIAVVIVVLIALFPFYWILRTALESNSQVAAGVGGKNGIIPGHLSGQAFVNVFTQQKFLTPLVNSIIVALATTVVTIIVASSAGYALARLNIRGAGAVLSFILLAGFFPVLAMIGPIFLILKSIGALDSIYPLIVVYLVYTLPISTWLLKNFFEQIPKDLEDAALTDGATRLQTLRKVVIPVASPRRVHRRDPGLHPGLERLRVRGLVPVQPISLHRPAGHHHVRPEWVPDLLQPDRLGGGHRLDSHRPAGPVRPAPHRLRPDRGFVPLTVRAADHLTPPIHHLTSPHSSTWRARRDFPPRWPEADYSAHRVASTFPV